MPGLRGGIRSQEAAMGSVKRTPPVWLRIDKDHAYPAGVMTLRQWEWDVWELWANLTEPNELLVRRGDYEIMGYIKRIDFHKSSSGKEGFVAFIYVTRIAVNMDAEGFEPWPS